MGKIESNEVVDPNTYVFPVKQEGVKQDPDYIDPLKPHPLFFDHTSKSSTKTEEADSDDDSEEDDDFIAGKEFDVNITLSSLDDTNFQDYLTYHTNYSLSMTSF